MLSSKFTSRRGSVIHVLVGCLGAGGILTAAVLSASSSASRSGVAPALEVSTHPADPEPLTSGELSRLLARVGMGPKALAAAGVTGVQAATMVGRVRTYLAENLQEIRDADEDFYSASNSSASLVRKVQSGLATEQEVTATATARAALASAITARQEQLDDLLTAAIGEGVSALGQQQAAMLARIRANNDWRGLPIQYRCTEPGTLDWLALHAALTSIRIAQGHGEEPELAWEQTVTTCDANEDVAAAAANLGSLGATVKAAWSQAVQQQE